MAARVSLGEIKTILQQYVEQQQRLWDDKEPLTQLQKIWNEYSRCLNKETPATPLLRDYIRIVSHFYEESKKTRRPNIEQMSKALDNLAQGMDVPRAIKRSRIVKEEATQSDRVFTIPDPLKVIKELAVD